MWHTAKASAAIKFVPYLHSIPLHFGTLPFLALKCTPKPKYKLVNTTCKGEKDLMFSIITTLDMPVYNMATNFSGSSSQSLRV